MTVEQQIQAAARQAAYNKGAAMKYEDIVNAGDGHKFDGIRPRYIAEQAELAGFPVWASCPDEAMQP